MTDWAKGDRAVMGPVPEGPSESRAVWAAMTAGCNRAVIYDTTDEEVTFIADQPCYSDRVDPRRWWHGKPMLRLPKDEFERDWTKA